MKRRDLVDRRLQLGMLVEGRLSGFALELLHKETGNRNKLFSKS